MINSLTLNILAYTCMIVGSYFALDFSIKQGNKVTKIINFIIMFWNMFMVAYLIKETDNILAGPINIRLNFFETVTNWLLALWLISFKFTHKK